MCANFAEERLSGDCAKSSPIIDRWWVTGKEEINERD